MTLSLGIAATPTASATSTARSDALPLERVRLYEIGVAYYERRGRRQRGRHSALPLPTAHIDDALKTLVVLSDDQRVRIKGLSYPTTVSREAARALAGLPESDDALAYGTLLSSLEGQLVRIEGDTESIEGRLVQVEGPLPRAQTKAPAEGDKSVGDPIAPEYELVLLVDGGGLERRRTSETRAVVPLEEGRRERLEMAAQSLSGTRAQQPSGFEFEVLAPGELALGYVAESALWGVNYRLVLDGNDARLQAWALVHNDTDEDWRDVDLELVNGQPQSFIYAQASPHYVEREFQYDERELRLSPQLSRSTPDEMAYGLEAGGFIAGAYGAAAGVGSVGYGRGGGGTGMGGIGYGTISPQVELGDLATLAQADGSESGAQFIYALPQSVDLEAHHSALLPVFTSTIDGTTITYWDAGQATAAVRLENDTRQTLPAGTISMFSGGGFAGEARLPRMKPGEAQFIFFGVELDVEVERRQLSRERRLLDIDPLPDGQVRLSQVDERELELVVHNRAGHAKRVVVALELPRNAKLSGADDVDWDETRQKAVVAVPTPARGEAKQHLRTQQAQVSTLSFAEISDKQLEHLAGSSALSSGDARALRELLEIRALVARTQSEQAGYERERQQALSRLQRARKDLEALGKASVRGDAARKGAKRIAALDETLEKLDVRITGALKHLESLEERRDTALQSLAEPKAATSQ